MPGLSFLAKKSWHTANLNNQEKVWIAQQKKAAEDSKIKELAKQIQQERQEEELNQMTGRKTRLDRGIDWMYQGSAGSGERHAFEEEQQQKDAEDFLLGKEYNDNVQHKKGGDFCNAEEASGGVAAVLTNASAVAESTQRHVRTNEAPLQTPIPSVKEPEDESREWNKEFRLKLEDPMFQVSQKRKEKEREEQRKRDLMERVKRDEPSVKRQRRDRRGRDERSQNSSDDTSFHRRDRKRRKKKHKKRKHRHRKRSRSRSPYDEEEEHYYSSARGNSRRDDRRSRQASYSSRSRSYSHSSDSRPRSPGRRYHPKRRRQDRSPSDERSRSKDRYRSQQRRSRSRSNSKPSQRNMYEREHYERRHQGEIDPRSETPSRGCHSNNGGRPISNRSAGNSRSLGPDSELLAKRRQEKEAARNRYRRHGSSRNVDSKESRYHSKMSREERNAAIRDMQNDAGSRTSRLAQVAVQPGENSKLLDDERKMRESKGRNFRGSGNFLTEMERKVNGIDMDTSMTSRVARN